MRLLLAEDEKELANALAAVLKHNNYSLDVVYNGADALDWAVNVEYDGLILDIMMPKLSGLEVLKSLRKQGNDVPILLLTAKSEIEDRVLGLDLGADDYLPKPFAMKELLARIRAMTRRKRVFTSNILEYGGVTLNRASFELACGGRAVQLGSKEYQMMEMMLQNPDQYFSAETFLERIWGYDAETEINVVWVYISYLRKKLAGLESPVEIRGVRKVGYRLGKKELESL